MLETNRGRALLVGVGIAVVVLAVIAVKRYRDTMEMPWALFTPNQQVAVVTRMAELRDKGLFGDAINLGLHSTNGHSDDYFIYQMIAATHFIRALHDKDQSGKWTKLGAEYSQKALDSNPKDIANVFNVGVNYRIARDDLDKGGCEYYRKAKALFESLKPLLQGDRAETQGRPVRLAAFRKRNEKELSGINERLRSCGPSAN
jgi:hypothetical protein